MCKASTIGSTHWQSLCFCVTPVGDRIREPTCLDSVGKGEMNFKITSFGVLCPQCCFLAM